MWWHYGRLRHPNSSRGSWATPGEHIVAFYFWSARRTHQNDLCGGHGITLTWSQDKLWQNSSSLRVKARVHPHSHVGWAFVLYGDVVPLSFVSRHSNRSKKYHLINPRRYHSDRRRYRRRRHRRWRHVNKVHHYVSPVTVRSYVPLIWFSHLSLLSLHRL